MTGAGDKIEFSSLTLSQTTAGAKVADQGSYAATLNLALSGDGSTTPILKWFTSGSDTYVVVDTSASNTFDPGHDYVVKVTGIHDLNVAGNVSSLPVGASTPGNTPERLAATKKMKRVPSNGKNGRGFLRITSLI